MEEYKAFYSDQRAALYKKRQVRGQKSSEKKFRPKRVGSTDEVVNQVSALVAVMKSEPEARGTATPSTNIKNPALKMQRILHE